MLTNYWAHKTWQPSEGQAALLTTAIERSSEWDVLVIEAPTAFGKSIAAKTLLKWAHKAHKLKGTFLVPNNLLVEQIARDYGLPTILRKSQYSCTSYAGASCSTIKSKEGGYCKKCPYTMALRRIRAVPMSVLNYHMYIAHKLKVPFVVVDEGHQALPLLQELAGKKIWQRDVGFPSGMYTVGDLKEWLMTCPGYDQGFPNDPHLKTLVDTLHSPSPSYLVDITEDKLRGNWEPVIKLLPIDVRQAPPYLWPKNKKLVLMSATISRVDVEELGLDSRRVLYLKAPSPIAPERRPIRIVPGVGSMSKDAQRANLPRLCRFLEQLLSRHKEKGIWHGTYSLNELLRTQQIDGRDRLMFFTSTTKKQVYEQWLASPPSEGRVLVAAGMHEGLDLKDDLARWGVVLKVPWLSLEDTAIRWKADNNPEWYAWQAIKMLCQAPGRTTRGPDDWSATYIVDWSFKKLWDQHQSLFPQWFQDAVIWERA